MTGYEAFGRIERGRVAEVPAWIVPASLVRVDASRGDAWDADSGEAEASAGHDWLASLREHWSMTTFFLFDPDSWR